MGTRRILAASHQRITNGKKSKKKKEGSLVTCSKSETHKRREKAKNSSRKSEVEYREVEALSAEVYEV